MIDSGDGVKMSGNLVITEPKKRTPNEERTTLDTSVNRVLEQLNIVHGLLRRSGDRIKIREYRTHGR